MGANGALSSKRAGAIFSPLGRVEQLLPVERVLAARAALLTRWFQFGVFTPIFRVHGTTAG